MTLDTKKPPKRSKPPREATPERKSEIKRVSDTLPKLYKASFERAAGGLASPRAAIKAKCQECVGYEEVRDRIRTCSCGRCPLWAYRPYVS